MQHVFISYSSKNLKQAHNIRTYLEAQGISCWMAPESIPAGSNYTKEIPVAIRDCRVFLLLLSHHSLKSDWVLKELDTALSKKKYVVPFMLEDCALTDEFEFLLAGCHRHFASAPGALATLAELIHTMAGSAPPPPPPPPPKRKWWIPLAAVALALLLVWGGVQVFRQNAAREQQADYRAAMALLEGGDYSGALEAFRELGTYQDAAQQVQALEQQQADYDAAVRLLNDSKFTDARAAFLALEDYRDSRDYAERRVPYGEAQYLMGCAADTDGPEAADLYDTAAGSFFALGGYTDSAELASECLLNAALIRLDNEDYDAAIAYLGRLNEADAEILRSRYAETCADGAFLMDIKEAYRVWLDSDDQYTFAEEIDRAWALMEPYEGTHFDDPNLANLLTDFRNAMETLKGALNEDGDSISTKSQYRLGEYYLRKLADTLYNDYQLFLDDVTLRRTFVGKTDAAYTRYELELSLEAWQRSTTALQGEDGRFYTTYANDTGHAFELSIIFVFKDADGNALDISEKMIFSVAKGATITIPLIPSTISDEEWASCKAVWDFDDIT